ncbi:MAG: PEGA domain-containing protein [Deltaproteobacteria bacterium]|nr:PEGA domain-containing protein [Deltaproteobacteria bacterium]MDQ3298510.1 PEGA domain-containing protein [Myxococcota bacterium]
MKSTIWSVVVMLFCAFAVVPMARAQPADALKKAQAAFDQAQLDYLQGKYDEAAAGFQEAYNARAFPQFLYNVGASFHMKGKKTSDVDSYTKAVDAYRRYLAADPQAGDKVKVEKAIGVLEAEIKRIKDSGAANTGSAAPPPAAPSAEVQQLGDVKVRGLVVIESEPAGATIYLDDKKKGAFGTTPWSGSLDGEHKVIVEKRGFMVSESTVAADPSKLFVLRAVLGKEDFLGWIEITSNVPGADVYIDDKSVGAVAKTPHSQNIKPGKHVIWVTTEGYDEYSIEVDVIPGGTHEVKAQLSGAPVGRINVIGFGIEDSTVYIDGKVACERGPCLKSAPAGDHTITVTRPGMKTYSRRVNIQAKTEANIKVTLAPTPSRSDAVLAYVLAGAFTAGGVVLGLKANGYRDDLKSEIAAGEPPPDTNDPRYTKGKIFAIAADVTFVLAGVTALTAVYYTFRDKGAPSTGLIDVRAMALSPQIAPGYAGVGMEVKW